MALFDIYNEDFEAAKQIHKNYKKMVSPQFMEEKPLSLVDVKAVLKKIEERDTELNHLSTKSKEYLEQFVKLTPTKKEELHKKLTALGLTRIKEEQLVKIIDFLPTTLNDLKVILAAYPLSLPKKDQESIVATVSEFLK